MGKVYWNKWRQENPSIKPDLSDSDLNYIDLREFDLSGTNFSQARLFETNLYGVNLAGANLNKASLFRAQLSMTNLAGASIQNARTRETNFLGSDLTKANLKGTILIRADFTDAILSNADLSEADLREARIHDTILTGAILTNCRVYGISIWAPVGLEEAEQSNLIITPLEEPVITVDNLEVAQFIYLLLHGKKIRNVIDTITSKVVLILGRFTEERKAVLDAVREELRKHNYLPVLFDFEKPMSRDITKTVLTLAHMSKFVIADITDPKSVPQELALIVPNLPSVPVQPILLSSAEEYDMFEHFKNFPWVLEIYRYNDLDDLEKSLGEKVIAPAECKKKRTARMQTLNLNNFRISVN